MILLYFNQNRPVFLILCAVLSYLLINFLKNKYGTAYADNAGFQNLCFFAPINFALFAFWPNGRLMNRHNILLLLLIFIQYTLAEQLSRHAISLNFQSQQHGSLSLWLFALTITAAFFRMTVSGTIINYALFFSLLNFFCGFYYAESAPALTIFFAAGMLTLTTAIIQTLYNETYKDSLTGLASRNSYIIQTKDFPLKYSIGLISIDDFDKLGQNFGRRNQSILTKLIAARITELENPDSIYRYSPDEFVIVFKNLDKNESFERLEAIRRAVASSSFSFSPRRKPLKLTISASISEKKRSDANSFEVLVRARKVLQKTRAFSHNVTSQA